MELSSFTFYYYLACIRHLTHLFTNKESYAGLELRYTNSLHDWINEKKLMKLELTRLSAEKRELELLCFELQKSALSPESLELIKCEVCCRKLALLIG